VTMQASPKGNRASWPTGARTRMLRLAAAGLLGAAAALIVSCGSTGKGLIPTGNAGPLQSDFEEVAQAAKAGNGSCTVTSAAILKTERDFAALPSSIDAGLRRRLHEGIANLRTRALVLCSQPLTPATVTGTTQRTTPSTSTTPPATQTSTTPTTPTSTTTPTTSSPGGGTPAPGVGGGEAPSGAGNGQGGGVGAGEGAPGGGSSGAGAGGGQEAGK
jgi:hypothetical protein